MSKAKQKEENGDIVLDLPIAERDALVEMYIDKHFLPVSKEMFGIVLKRTGSVEVALYDATLNEMVNTILTEEIEKRNTQEYFTNDE